MPRGLLLLSVLLFGATSAFAGTGRIIIVNRDFPGMGFNDTTPAAPVDGNPGTTIGQQRMNVFERAAQRWSSVLDTNVDIRVRASFAPLPCSATGSVVLGQARAETWHHSFPGAPKPNVLYPAALANKLAGRDLSPTDEIFAQFSSALDLPTCLGDAGWYYGFEAGHDNWFYAVVLHEIGHGLGMAGYGFPDFYNNIPTVYDTHILDRSAGLRWDQMTVQQRTVSMTNTGNVVWDGPNVKEKAPALLEPVTTLTITEPSPVARDYDIGTAAFGPPPNRTPMTGPVVAAVDAETTEGPTTSDGCSEYSNASAVRGKIALVNRGGCTFVQKAVTAQAAGAVGLIVVDDSRGETTCMPPGMASDGTEREVYIPVISVTQSDGNALRTQLASATVGAMLRVDPSRRAGTSPEGYVRLYAPCKLQGGSSISHWDTVATPNLLMEPAINSDLIDSVDLSIYQMMDIGWTQPPRTGRRFVRK